MCFFLGAVLGVPGFRPESAIVVFGLADEFNGLMGFAVDGGCGGPGLPAVDGGGGGLGGPGFLTATGKWSTRADASDWWC